MNINAPRAALTLGLCLLASTTSASATWRAWSDQTKLPPLSEHRAAIAELKGKACAPTVRDYKTPGLAPGGGLNYDEMIKQLEEMLARMKPSDANYAALQQSLKQLREQKEKMAKGFPPLPVGTAKGAMSFQTALDNAEKLLGANARKATPGAGVDVAGALAAGNPKAALAMLLAAHRATPKNPWILINAAGLLTLTGLPQEAIAFLDAAEKLGGTLPAPSGVPGKALALSNRGHAFLGLGRWKEAEAPLRAALKLAPDFAEARANLSQALLCQGNLDGAVQALRVAMRRTLEAQASPEYPVKESVPGRHGGGLERKENAPTRRAAKDMFDLSRGADFNLPPLKLPANRREGIALYEQYVALERAGKVEVDALLDRAGEQSAKVKLDAGEQRWSALVNEAMVNGHFEPHIWPVYKAAYDTHYAWNDALPRFAKALNEAVDRADPAAGCEAYTAQMDAAVGAFLDGMRVYVKGQEFAMRQYAAAMVKHETALIANLTDPNARAAKRAYAEARAKGIYYGLIVGSARQMASFAHTYRLKCDEGALQNVALDAGELPELSSDPCGGVPTGVKLKSKVPSSAFNINGYGLSFGLSCQKLEIELSASVVIGLFAAAHVDWKGTGTVFFGIKAEGKVPVTGLDKFSLGAKESVYVKFSKDGILDAGLRVEGKATAGAGLNAAAGLWEAKFDQEFGVAAAVAYWTER